MQTNRSDLKFQPKTQPYTFVDKKLKLKHRIKALLIILGLILLILTPLTTAFLLNYFYVLQLARISPVFENLPRSPYPLEDLIKNYLEDIQVSDTYSLSENTFGAEGKIEDFGQDFIKVKLTSGRALRFELTQDTQIYKILNDKSSMFMFTSDLLQKENIGKKAIVEFIKEGNVNKLINIKLE